MLLEVPDPVWKTSMGNCESHWPAATSAAASLIAFAIAGSMTPSSALTAAASPLMDASAAMRSRSITKPGDREVLDRALSLRTPLGVERDADVAHAVVLEAVLGL